MMAVQSDMNQGQTTPAAVQSGIGMLAEHACLRLDIQQSRMFEVAAMMAHLKGRVVDPVLAVLAVTK